MGYRHRDYRCVNSTCDGWRPNPSLIPDFYFVPIRVGDIDVGITGRELTAPQNGATRAFDFGDRKIDVACAPQTKPKMRDATAHNGSNRILLEGDDVMWTRAQHLDGRGVSKILPDSEDLRVKPDRPFEVADGETDVREPVGLEQVKTSASVAKPPIGASFSQGPQGLFRFAINHSA